MKGCLFIVLCSLFDIDGGFLFSLWPDVAQLLKEIRDVSKGVVFLPIIDSHRENFQSARRLFYTK
jgi:hypothetical protein